MSERKQSRKERKLRKKKAMLQLVDSGASDASESDCDPAVESRKRGSTNQDAAMSKEDVDRLINSAYQTMVAKKRKLDERPACFYVDETFLSRRRQKLLLYNDGSDLIRAPLCLHSSQIQSFIMYCLFKQKSMYRPRWCNIQHVSTVRQMVVLLLEDISWTDVNISHPSAWRDTIAYLSSQSIRMTSPCLFGTSVDEDLFMLPLSVPEVANTLKKRNRSRADCRDEDAGEERAAGEEQTAGSDDELDTEYLLSRDDTFSRTHLLLPVAELVAEGFPLPNHEALQSQDCDAFDGFVFSKDHYSGVAASSPMYSIDCEMVLTADDRLSLASVCVVDERLNVVYKTLVRPDKEIKDYLTRFSGMTADLLSDVTTSLADVQAELRRLLPADAILCGQSLNSDLAALKMYHPYVIDTSVIYNLKGMPYSKTALKTLASYFLKKEIQTGSDGHCPEEDARTAMQLILLKLKIGYTFGNALVKGQMTPPAQFFRPAPSAQDKVSKPDSESSERTHAAGCTRSHSNSPNRCDHISPSTSPAQAVSTSEPSFQELDNVTTEPTTQVTSGSEAEPTNCKSNGSTADLNDQKPSDSLTETTDQQSADSIAESPDNVMSGSEVELANQGSDSSTAGPTINQQTVSGGGRDGACRDTPRVEPLAVFSRKHVPQLEMNMFDMIGHQDQNTGAVCTQKSSRSELSVHERSSVSLFSSKKSSSVVQSAEEAIGRGASITYVRLSGPRSTGTGHKKHAEKMDSYVANLWRSLPNRSLFCLVLGGTSSQPGGVMFNTKTGRGADYSGDTGTSTTDAGADINSDDVYASIYGL